MLNTLAFIFLLLIVASAFLVPILSVLFFIFSLVLFCSARKRNRQVPESYSKKQMMLLLMMLIISSAVLGFLLLFVFGFILWMGLSSVLTSFRPVVSW